MNHNTTGRNVPGVGHVRVVTVEVIGGPGMPGFPLANDEDYEMASHSSAPMSPADSERSVSPVAQQVRDRIEQELTGFDVEVFVLTRTNAARAKRRFVDTPLTDSSTESDGAESPLSFQSERTVSLAGNDVY